MTRKPSWIKRGPRLTKKEREAMRIAQGGICATPNCTSTGPFEEDHENEVAFGNTGKPNRLLCVPCNRRNGSDTARRAVKADRQGGRCGQYARRQRNGPKLVGRGFDKGLTKKFDGTVVERVK